MVPIIYKQIQSCRRYCLSPVYIACRFGNKLAIHSNNSLFNNIMETMVRLYHGSLGVAYQQNGITEQPIQQVTMCACEIIKGVWTILRTYLHLKRLELGIQCFNYAVPFKQRNVYCRHGIQCLTQKYDSSRNLDEDEGSVLKSICV